MRIVYNSYYFVYSPFKDTAYKLSGWLLVALTTVRFISIRNPLRFQSILTTKRAIISIVSLSSFIIVSNVLLHSLVKKKPDYDGSCYFEKIYDLHHCIIVVVMAFLLPFSIILILYSNMYCIARKQIRFIATDVKDSDSAIWKRELNLFKVVSILLGFYIIAWLPISIYLIVAIICKSCKINKYAK